jgi:hypothetical protein
MGTISVPRVGSEVHSETYMQSWDRKRQKMENLQMANLLEDKGKYCTTAKTIHNWQTECTTAKYIAQQLFHLHISKIVRRNNT